MTLEQFNTLSAYEESFQEARSNYYRSILMSELNVMNNVWEDIGHERADLSCGRCVLKFLQMLGSEYYDFKESLKQEENTPKINTKKNAKKKQ